MAFDLNLIRPGKAAVARKLTMARATIASIIVKPP
jgi:hypothetical protein